MEGNSSDAPQQAQSSSSSCDNGESVRYTNKSPPPYGEPVTSPKYYGPAISDDEKSVENPCYRPGCLNAEPTQAIDLDLISDVDPDEFKKKPIDSDSDSDCDSDVESIVDEQEEKRILPEQKTSAQIAPPPQVADLPQTPKRQISKEPNQCPGAPRKRLKTASVAAAAAADDAKKIDAE